MSDSNEQKITVPSGWEVKVTNKSDGSSEITIKMATVASNVASAEHVLNKTSNLRPQDDVFRFVRASKLDVEYFRSMRPSHNQPKAMHLYMEILRVIKRGVGDFWRPIYDPSFDEEGRICYAPEKRPARGKKSYNWWVNAAKNVYPERKSRLGTNDEYIAFLAVLIKELIGAGMSREDAWNAMCEESEDLGVCLDYDESRAFCAEEYGNWYELTGSRRICGWYDLGNTEKLLADVDDADSFWIAGTCTCLGVPLARMSEYGVNEFEDPEYGTEGDFIQDDACGWIVLTEPAG